MHSFFIKCVMMSAAEMMAMVCVRENMMAVKSGKRKRRGPPNQPTTLNRCETRAYKMMQTQCAFVLPPKHTTLNHNSNHIIRAK